MTDDGGARSITGAVAAVVLVAAVGALLVVLQPLLAPTGRLLEDFPAASIEATIDQSLGSLTLRPTASLRVTGQRVVWQDATGAPFFSAPRVSARVRIGADGDVVVSDGTVESPEMRLVQTGEESWNYDAPLAPFLGGNGPDGAEAPRTIVLGSLVVTDGYVLLDLLEATYEVRSLELRLAGGQLSGPGLAGPTFEVAEAEADLVLPDTGQGRVTRNVGLADSRFQVIDGAVNFQIDRARFGGSRLADANGVWDPSLGGFGLDLQLTATDARLVDVPWLRGEVPEGAAGSFRLRVEPRPQDRTLVEMSNLDLRAPGSSARGSVRAVVGGARPPVLESIDVRVDPLSLDLVEAFAGPLPYGGTVRGSITGTGADLRFDLAGRLTSPTAEEPFDTELTGRVALTDDGVEIRSVRVALDRVPLDVLGAVAPGFPFRGPVTGTIELGTPSGSGPMGVDLRLETGGGVLTLAGTIDLTGAVPIYDVNGRVAGVDLRSVLRPAAPPAELHARFRLNGRGTNPRSADASLDLQGTFTGWQTEPSDTIAIEAAIRGGTVDAKVLRLALGPLSWTVDGRWNFIDGEGAVAYDLAVSDVQPLAPYLPADPAGRLPFAQGALELAGRASGTLEAPILEGRIAAGGFRWGEWAAESLTGEYWIDARRDLPRIETQLEGDEVRTPGPDFDAVDLTADASRSSFEASFRADQEGGRGIVELAASGRIDESGRRDITIRTLEVDLRNQRWRLPSPSEISWTRGEAIQVVGFVLGQANGPGRLKVDGVAAPVDDMDLSIDAHSLPVEDLVRLSGSDAELTGLLSFDSRLTGPADGPDLQLEAALTNGSLRGVRVRSLEANARYDTGTLALDVQGLIGDSAQVRIEGTIPAELRLSGSPLFGLVDEEPIDLRILTSTFPLATLDPGLRMVEKLEGRLEATIRVAGTPAAPQLSGSARLMDAAVTIPVLERRFRNINGSVLLEGRQARIRRLVVGTRAEARAQGTLDFVELTDPVLDLSAELDGFKIQGIEGEKEAGVSGTLTLTGSLRRPVVAGAIRADDGALSLAPLRQPELSSRFADGRSLDLAGRAGFDLEPPESGGVEIRRLTFQAGNNLWFVTEEARVRLAGTLTVDKSGESVTVQGTLSGEGGSFELAAGPINRRFQINSAELRFFGSPEPNPRLDILASRLVRIPDGGDVEIEVRVGGTLENPSLSLATGSGPAIPESELLSFLLFGRPTSDLTQVAGAEGTGGLLGQGVAYLGLAEALFSRLNDELGFLDYFQIDYTPGGGLFATAGVELLHGLYLNADLPIGDERNIYAAGLEYRTDFGRFRFAYEPVEQLGRFVGARTLSFIEAEILRQWIFAWRRRWTY